MKASVDISFYRGFQDFIHAKVFGASIGAVAFPNGSVLNEKFNDLIPAINVWLKRV